ncbi:MAG TPA: hypothetical protein VMX54_14965 [Vicinamibacteria bacterium]|nr:hypothetical protein [Vicinamibacteria bacterium]
MARQSDFTPEEWRTLAAGPMAAGMYVILSQLSGPVGLVEESWAIASEVRDATRSENELVRAIADADRAAARHVLPEMPGDRQTARVRLLDGVREAMAALGAKAPADVDAYGQWLYAVAEKTAAAAKEGGFLGIGGTPVSAAEKAALAELAAVLKVKP